jgi:uncharacterized protein
MFHRRSFPLPRLWMTLFLVLCVAALSAQTPPAAPGAPTQRLFWKITSPTTEVYFLGSIHVAAKDMYPLPPEIETAFKQATNLVVEADITKVDQMVLAVQVMQQGMYTQGDSLDKHLTPDTMKKLQEFCTVNQMPAAIFNMMKPPLAATTVQAMLLEKTGLSADDGIDKHFLDEVSTTKDKKIVELESADAQLKLLFGVEDKLAEKWLLETMKDNSKDELDKLIKAWKEGDVKTVETLAIEDTKNDPDEQKLADLLVFKRNDEMTKKVDELLRGKDKSFVVVGAAHLIGDKGILKQLEAKGFNVERPTLTVPPPTAVSPARAPTAPAGQAP